jgi:hypothetical protein
MRAAHSKTRGWDMTVACVTHTCVIEQRVVVTVLGYGMHVEEAKPAQTAHTAVPGRRTGGSSMQSSIRAITIWQPWASLIIIGAKP